MPALGSYVAPSRQEDDRRDARAVLRSLEAALLLSDLPVAVGGRIFHEFVLLFPVDVRQHCVRLLGLETAVGARPEVIRLRPCYPALVVVRIHELRTLAFKELERF